MDFLQPHHGQMMMNAAAGGLNAGQVQQQAEGLINKFVPVQELRNRFQVSHKYVVTKVAMMLMPFRYRFKRQDANAGGDGNDKTRYYNPIDDAAAPDLYIPTMAVLTYIVLTAFITGVHTELNPVVLGSTAWVAVFSLLVETVAVMGWRYAVALPSTSFIDLFATFGYIFVPVCMSVSCRFFTQIIVGAASTGGGDDVQIADAPGMPNPFNAEDRDPDAEQVAEALKHAASKHAKRVAAAAAASSSEAGGGLFFYFGCFILCALFALFLLKTLTELLSSHGHLDVKAYPIVYGATAFQLVLFAWMATRPFSIE